MKNIYRFFLITVLIPVVVDAQILMNVSQMEIVKNSLEIQNKNDIKKLEKNADEYCKIPYVSVMNKKHIPKSGSMHDYMSLAQYSWPNPQTSNGLPYISIDGKINPEMAEYDRHELAKFSKRLKILGLAYFYSNNEKYAEYAVEQLKAWFINDDTKMNPNMTFAQIVPGTNDDLGKPQGIIDSYSFVSIIDYILILKMYKGFSEEVFRAIQAWYGELSKWLENSPQGIAASKMKNNAYAMYVTQLLAFKFFSSPQDVDELEVRQTLDRLIAVQFDDNGKQPKELKRVNSFFYSQFNLTHIVDYVVIAKYAGIDVLKDDKTRLKFYKGVDFLANYLGKDQSSWEFSQKEDWHDSQMALCETLYRIYTRCDSSRSHYLQLYKQHYLADRNNFFALYN